LIITIHINWELLNRLLGIDKRAVSRNERSGEIAEKTPAEENRTLIFDTGMKEKRDFRTG